jgi:hypothetical protein
MNVVERGTLDLATSITCTTGGDMTGGPAFLQPDAVNTNNAGAISNAPVKLLAIRCKAPCACVFIIPIPF